MLSREGKQTDRGAVGAEFIGYNRRRREALLLQEFPHQPNCRPSVPAGLNQEIQDFALTVHGTPEIELPPSNYDDHLVQVPAFGRSWPPTLNPPRIGPTEFQDPSSNCLIRDVETTLGKQVLNVPIAQRETAIEPDGMLDDDRWKAVTTVGYLAHPETLKHRPCRSHAVNVTMPIAAIRSVTSSEGRVAIIEGAAGSGKTTTLRPIADLYREHGQSIIATAVAWRTAVALGNDVDARPFCVDKLLRLAARGGIEINKDTTIIVDEAGMLSTRQAHHILQLSERHGAKIVFAGDTQQQQPVEAGPGLRLIRDAVGSVRVDRIRRQKADPEDILVHVHGETPEAARFRAELMGEQERAKILGDYEAMAECLKPFGIN